MALTKADLAESLFNELGLNKREAKEFVELFFEKIRKSRAVRLFNVFQYSDLFNLQSIHCELCHNCCLERVYETNSENIISD